MPKKKGTKKNRNADFTLNDCANAPKPVSRVKKAASEDAVPDLAWDEIQDDDLDIVEEVSPDGTKNFVCKKKKSNPKSEPDNIDDRPGIDYPEIVWYLVSQFIKPEDIGTFACINKATYAITKRESFWRSLYRKYCQNHPKLPEKLRLENSYQLYGLRQRVIRALYHTYDVFIKKCVQETNDYRPHSLIKRCCVNVWYYKGPGYWSVFFKLKKLVPRERIQTGQDFFEELGRIDANPDEDTQVLQVTCRSFYEVPPLMGLTLSMVSVVLAQGFRHHKLQLGFHSSRHNITRKLLPECIVVLDTVINMYVYDWWHPKYPYFDNVLRRDEEAKPVLKKDFFTINDGEL